MTRLEQVTYTFTIERGAGRFVDIVLTDDELLAYGHIAVLERPPGRVLDIRADPATGRPVRVGSATGSW